MQGQPRVARHDLFVPGLDVFLYLVEIAPQLLVEHALFRDREHDPVQRHVVALVATVLVLMCLADQLAALEALSLADALNARERDAAAERASDPAPSPPDAGLLSVMEARAELAIRKIRPPDDDRAAAFKVRLKRARGGVWHTTASGGWYETQYASGVPPWVPDLHITPEDRKAFLGESAGDGADNIRHELHHNAGFAHFMKLKLDLKAKAKRAKKELGVAGKLGRRIDAVLDEATRRLDMARLRRAEAASGDASETAAAAAKTAGAPGLAVMMKAMGKFRKQGKAARERKAQRVPFYKAYRPGRRVNESVIVHAGDSDDEWGGGGSSDGESFGAAPKVRRFGAIRRKRGASPSRKGREPSRVVHHARAFGVRPNSRDAPSPSPPPRGQKTTTPAAAPPRTPRTPTPPAVRRRPPARAAPAAEPGARFLSVHNVERHAALAAVATDGAAIPEEDESESGGDGSGAAEEVEDAFSRLATRSTRASAAVWNPNRFKIPST